VSTQVLVSVIRPLKFLAVVMALHLIVLPFFIFKLPVNYFGVVCLSTVVVWSAVFSFGAPKKRTAMISGALFRPAVQEIAYQAWLSNEASVWGLLAQFLSLQYMVVLSLGSPPGKDH